VTTRPKLYGCQSMTGELRRVLVRAPRDEDQHGWGACGWREEPDTARIAQEHEEFCAILADAGAEVVLAESDTRGNPDAIYTYDPALVTDDGALLLHPGKRIRRDEVDAMAADFERVGAPIAGRLEDPTCAEGGDFCWLDERTLLAGRGYRTNSDGICALERLLGVEVLVFDLPHFHGPGEVMHLLSLLSPLDGDLVVAYPPLMPVRLVQLLEERGIRIVEVPHEEFETMGANVLALAPRVALMLERNVETRRRLERAGVEVLVYEGVELSKGDGGPTCLTRPLLRA
jgi:N-dimethylarginine dimethylaminohydrolase